MPPICHPDWYNEGIAHIWQPYAQAKIAPQPLPVAYTGGCNIVLENGESLIDGVSSWWCTPHGHRHPYLIEAAKSQLDVMPNVMFAGLAHEPAYILAKRLVQLMPGNTLQRVFFSDSGSTAVEVALKIALQYWQNIGKHKKTKFLCLERGYHGDTFGAMSVSDPKRGMHHAYRHNVIEHEALAVPKNEDELHLFETHIQASAETVAALVVEPLVQGAGGLRFYEPDILRHMAECCKKHDILLIADEIMTGFGRTGEMFACSASDIVPDIICIGKGLTGGIMTLAATLATDQIYQAFYDDDINKALMHGPTFMANPLACAVANASLDLFEQEPRLQQVADIEGILRSQLTPLTHYSVVEEVRVKGAIGVVQLDAERFNPFKARPLFVGLGCWLRPYMNIIYVMPPFVISRQQLMQLTDAIAHVVSLVEQGDC